VTSSTKRSNPGWQEEIRKRALEAARQEIHVGWSTEMGASSETVEIAIWNALGTDTIPARPTLETTMLASRATIDGANQAIVRAINRDEDPTGRMDFLAVLLESAHRETVVNLADPPNAASVEREKGFNDPLVGTGADGGRLVRELASQRLTRS
jgi:hypothetical protein